MEITPKSVVTIAGVALGGLFGVSLLFGSFYTVQQGERGLVFRLGQLESVETEGLHFKVPFISTVQKVDIRTQRAESPADAGTRDMQHVQTKVSLNYHLDAAALKDTYSRVGLDVESRVIDSRIQEVVKAVIARFSAEELLLKRDEVKQEIAAGLRNTLRPYNVVSEDIQITNFSFSQSFDHAIEAKQTAEQNALKAKNDLQRIEIEAQQKVAMAKAEAEAIRIQADAIRAQGGAEYVQLKAIEKWNGQLPHVSSNSVPFINIK